MHATRRQGVVTSWTEVVYDGRVVTRTSSTTARVSFSDYWAFPAAAIGSLKLGELVEFKLRELVELKLKDLATAELDRAFWASRFMLNGRTEHARFATREQAEAWIARSDRWRPRRNFYPEERRKAPASDPGLRRATQKSECRELLIRYGYVWQSLRNRFGSACHPRIRRQICVG